jgi:RimJ/RimL family protein N-acetyltransferase
MKPEIPTSIETGRITLRCYQADDGPWYFAMSQRIRDHLARYEAGNPVMTIGSEAEAIQVMRTFASAWQAQESFFMGVFDRKSGEFVAQVVVGPVNQDRSEFTIGYFADTAHEGQGYVTEAVKAALGFVFQDLQGQRVLLQCADTNERSRAVAERCGMVLVGHVKEKRRIWVDICAGRCISECKKKSSQRLIGDVN